MTAFALKLIACLTMLIDHAGFLFFPRLWILRVIGRIAMPLFAFMVAEGFRKTRSVPRYAKRLLLLGLVSQVPYSAMYLAAGVRPLKLNILFLLAGGLGMLYLLDRQRFWLGKVAVVTVACLAAQLAPVEYGAYGLLLILASYIFLQWRPAGLGMSILTTYFSTLSGLVAMGLTQLFALLSLPFIWLYNGQLGPKRYQTWFYWFYPVHVAVLASVKAMLVWVNR